LSKTSDDIKFGNHSIQCCSVVKTIITLLPAVAEGILERRTFLGCCWGILRENDE